MSGGVFKHPSIGGIQFLLRDRRECDVFVRREASPDPGMHRLGTVIGDVRGFRGVLSEGWGFGFAHTDLEPTSLKCIEAMFELWLWLRTEGT